MENRLNIDIKDLAKRIEAKDQYVIVAEFPEIDYTLIYRPTEFEPWIAAWGFDKERGDWAQGHFFPDINKAMRHIQNKIDVVPFLRLDEIASKAIDGLIQDDPYEAEIYLKEEMELTFEEAEYFGIGETLDMVKGYKEDDDYENM